jgi:transcriptional regulator with XRE-family HTH domain
MTKFNEPKQIKITWRRMTVNAEIRRFRDKLKWTNRQLASAFGISRDYVKKILRRRKPFIVRPRIEDKFRALQACTQPALAEKRKPRERVILSWYRIPEHVRNLVVATKCRGHEQWHFFPQKTQVYCGEECKKLWRKKTNDRRPDSASHRVRQSKLASRRERQAAKRKANSVQYLRPLRCKTKRSRAHRERGKSSQTK